MSEPVTIRVVANELDAEVACGLLRSEGIKCMSAATDYGQGIGDTITTWVPQAILVAPEDAERARELLAEEET